jgi:hypothetical protein
VLASSGGGAQSIEAAQQLIEDIDRLIAVDGLFFIN